MIQRIQTIWLILASIFSFASLEFSFFSGNKLVENTKVFVKFTAIQSFPIMLITVAIGLATFFGIFVFKNRSLQIKLVLLCMIASVINLYLYHHQTKSFIATDWSFDLSALLAAAIPICLFLAVTGIRKDQQLIKNIDKLR